MTQENMSMTQLRKIRINRARWRAGEGGAYTESCGSGSTELLNQEGFMCCLGFATQQLARKKKYLILNEGDPSTLDFVVKPLNKRLDDGTIVLDELSNAAITINDCEHTRLEQKEKELTELFAKYNLKLEFFGEYTYA